MVEQVVNKILYHVSAAAPHKAQLVAGQTVVSGTAHNPFFAFYDTIPLTYPITENGQVVQVSGVAWLKRVNLGLLQPHSMQILAGIANDVTMRYVMLARELIMEELRLADFSGAPPSRQTCLYCADTLTEAKSWVELLGVGSVCELNCTGTIHRTDSRLLLADNEPISVTKERGRQYWRGESGPTPRIEVLFSGTATVQAVGL